MRTLIEANELQPDDIVSGLFTVTNDLDAAFPARAAEEFGWGIVALLVYTSRMMTLEPGDVVLDPCSGAGAFCASPRARPLTG